MQENFFKDQAQIWGVYLEGLQLMCYGEIFLDNPFLST